MKQSIRARLDKPTLVTLSQDGDLPEEVLVLPIGSYKTYIGKIDITDEMLSEMVDNFSKGVPNGVPVNFDHTYGEAAGWVTGLTHKAGEGLFAAVEWTSKGAEALRDKIYRFLSAEFSTEYEDSTFGQFHGNVLSGIGLTNYPMLQNIPALLSQNDTNPITILFSQEGASMNLDEIRAKDAADLTDEERAFLQEHSADLNEDERTRFEIEAPAAPEEPQQPESPEQPEEPEAPENPETPATAELSQGQNGTVTLSAARLEALEKMANDGQRAMVELNQNRMRQEIVQPMVFSKTNKDGKFFPKSKDRLEKFVFGLSEAQRKEFSALVGELPSQNRQLTEELGDGGDVQTGSSRLNHLAQQRVASAKKEGREITFSQALDEVVSENPSLVDEEYSLQGGE